MVGRKKKRRSPRGNLRQKFNIDAIRELLLSRRLRLGLTQGDVARRIGIKEGSRAIIHRLEHGLRAMTLEEYVALCQALRIEPWRPLRRGSIVIPVTRSQYEEELVFQREQNDELRRENRKLKTLLDEAEKSGYVVR